ncbi:AmpE protein [Klebsiella michiganensis]|uniref:AmpE protein n=1 Tax=Klebsiella michiganensis TaxID=1134687 RepID=A0A7H4N7J8_9ENTR|nr:AmpE protein [Klebsiella michiganensis]
MTLFTTLLVLIAERLFKLGEHWQLDHRLEVLFRRVKHYSLLTTLLMTVAAGGGRVYYSASAAGAAV